MKFARKFAQTRTMSSNFQLSSKIPNFLSTNQTLSTYSHSKAKLDLIHLPLESNPLISLNIVIPTLSTNHKGLPHTLEHLIFVGSELHPNRGYLDYVATRQQSDGTNAYTSEDHTSYQLTTSSPQGLLLLLPIFLDHILRPNLTSSQFVTEVYHTDENGKSQGVVWCEMASREWLETDVRDLYTRKGLYSATGSYAYECGGLTKDIAQLSIDEIRKYHQKFYTLRNCSVILTGNVDIAAVMGKIDGYLSDDVIQQCSGELPEKKETIVSGNLHGELVQEKVYFPSSDEDYGSITFGWRGPPSDDLESIISLEILFRFLTVSASSPFHQKFVECSQPIASDVEYEFRNYFDTSFTIVFDGVGVYSENYVGSESENSVDGSDSEDAMSTDESDSESDDGNIPTTKDTRNFFGSDLLVYKSMKELLVEVRDGFLTSPSIYLPRIHLAIKRHIRKIKEGLEEDPHEILPTYIIPDIIRSTFSSNRVPAGHTYSSLFPILESLLLKPEAYWADVIQSALIEKTCVQVFAIPSKELTKTIEDGVQAAILQNTPKHPKKVKKYLEGIVKENGVNLKGLKVDGIPGFEFKQGVCTVDVLKGVGLPFGAVQIVGCESSFVHSRFFFDTKKLPNHLLPYLVLFQELLFQSPIIVAKNKKYELKPYQIVVDETSELLISHDTGVGLANSGFSCGWLGELFVIGGTCEEGKEREMVQHLFGVLGRCFWDFERVMSVAKNLRTDVLEEKRSGGDMLNAISTRLTSPCKNSQNISVFKQEDFLSKIIKATTLQQQNKILDSLFEIQNFLINIHQNTLDTDITGFACISLPRKTSLSNDQVLDIITSEWLKIQEWWKIRCFEDLQIENLRQPHLLAKNKRLDKRLSSGKSKRFPLPYPRENLFSVVGVDESFKGNICTEIAGLQTCFFSISVECDVIYNKRDFYAVGVLNEIMSRTEGPLYSAVRGKGLAYGAYTNLSSWSGELVYEIMDSSDAKAALDCFFGILKYIGTEEGFSDYCGDLNIETAKSSTSFKVIQQWATPSSVISSTIQASILQFSPDVNVLSKEFASFSILHDINADDIRRVYNKYFKKFLNADERVCFLTFGVGGGDEIIQGFLKGEEDEKVEFKKVSLKELKI